MVDITPILIVKLIATLAGLALFDLFIDYGWRVRYLSPADLADHPPYICRLANWLADRILGPQQ